MEEVLGAFVGVFIGLILVGVILKFIRKDNSLKAKYDERQELARGKGYKYGFFTLMIAVACLMILEPVLIKYVESEVLYFGAICIAVFVFGGYCIWNEAYLALNEQTKRTMVCFTILGGINFIGGLVPLFKGHMIEDGKISVYVMNLMCGFMMLGFALVLAVKKFKDKKEEE